MAIEFKSHRPVTEEEANRPVRNLSQVKKSRIGQRRLGCILQRALLAGADLSFDPLWELIGFSIYGYRPIAMRQAMDLRDSKVPNDVWGDLITAMPEGVQLHPLTYRPEDRKDRRNPAVNLRHLGVGFYGVIALTTDDLQIENRTKVGVLLFDRFGAIAVNSFGAAVTGDVARCVEYVEDSGLFSTDDFDFPYADNDEQYDLIRTCAKRLIESDQLVTMGL